MKRTKKLIAISAIIFTVFLLGACADTVIASSTYSGSIEQYENNGSSRFYVYVDPDTGVNYMVYAAPYKGGITPRYNANGSLFVSQ